MLMKGSRFADDRYIGATTTVYKVVSYHIIVLIIISVFDDSVLVALDRLYEHTPLQSRNISIYILTDELHTLPFEHCPDR